MTQPDPLVGRTLERYAILKLIGEGGMGSVYLAEHSRIQRKVAVKVLHPHLAKTHPDIAQRMQNEAKAAAMIGHPGIVDVIDYGETDDGLRYLVMELLDGQELAAVLDKSKTLPQAVALAVIDAVLAALGAAHEKGIVHRDLKPDNIFLHVARNGLYEVKLLDFGISKFTANREMRLTVTGAVMGTPHYMSLEQTEGRPDVDHRTDLYAAAVILYQALSGQRPFDGENVNQVMVAILKGEHRPLAEVCPDLDPALADVIQRGMARKREDRWGSAGEFREAIQPFWDPADPAIAEIFQEISGSDPSAAPVGVLGASGRFHPAPGSGPVSPAVTAPPSAGPAEAATQLSQSAGAPSPAPTARQSNTLPLRPAAPSGAHPAVPSGAHPAVSSPGMPTVQQKTSPGPTGPTPPGTPPPFEPGRWLGQIPRATWMKVLWIALLIIFVATTTALIATNGCSGCGEGDQVRKKSRKKRHRRKKKRKKDMEPDVIKKIRKLF